MTQYAHASLLLPAAPADQYRMFDWLAAAGWVAAVAVLHLAWFLAAFVLAGHL